MKSKEKMVADGHLLDDTDIQILLECYRKKHNMETPENIAVTPAVCDISTSPIRTMLIQEWEKMKKASYPRKWAIPLRIPGFAHWNVIEITQDDENSIFCRQLDTNGYSYPLRNRELGQIRDFLKDKKLKCNVRTQSESKQVYSFGLQRDNNCGIVAACIISDIETNRIPHHTQNTVLDCYGGCIKESQHEYSRDVMAVMVRRYGDDSQKERYCQTRGGNGGAELSGSRLRAAGGFKYDSQDRNQKEIYEGFEKSEETLIEIIELMNEYQDQDGEILNAIRKNDALYDRAKFIFENHNSEDKKVKDGWMNIAIFVLKEKLRKKDSGFAQKVSCIFADNNPEGDFSGYWKQHFTKETPASLSDDTENSMYGIIVLLLALVIGSLIPAKIIAIVVATVLAAAATMIALDWFTGSPQGPRPSGKNSGPEVTPKPDSEAIRAEYLNSKERTPLDTMEEKVTEVGDYRIDEYDSKARPT